MTKIISLGGRKCGALMVGLHVDGEVVRRGLIAMLNSASSRYRILPFESLEGNFIKNPEGAPEVVILACDDENVEDIECLAQRIWEVGSKVLVLLSQSSEELFDSVARISTDGFLLLDQLTTESLDDSLQKVAKGEVVIPTQIAGRLLERTRNGQREPHPVSPDLTPRERQALQLLVEGLSNKQIATKLRISSHGAKRLVANLLAKLNCTNRTMAASMALKYKLVEQDSTAYV